MKKILILLFVAMFGLASAQEKVSKIDFKNVDLPTALKMAKESGKQIFCDFNTTWCGPCKTLYNDVFTDDKAGKLINDNFISLYINAEAKEWIEVAKKYKVTAYPTMLILNDLGEEKFRLMGSVSLNRFLFDIGEYLNPERSPEALERRYKDGERTPELINSYTYNLMKNGAEKEGFLVVNNYFNSLSDDAKMAKDNWFLYSTFALNYEDVKAKYLVANYHKFYKNIDKAIVDDKVANFVRSDIGPYVSGYLINEGLFDAQKFEHTDKVVEGLDIPQKPIIVASLNIAKARVKCQLNKKDSFEHFINTCKKEFNNLDQRGSSLVVLNLSNLNLVASDKAKLGAIELIEMHRAKYVKTPVKGFDVLQKAIDGLKPVKRGDVIAFEENLSFEKALAKAEKEKKLIFIDCYTAWCGPCKTLAQEVFTVDYVKKYFDKNFVNLKIDMEKGEGPVLAKKFKIKGYPTLLLVNSKGEVVHEKVGSASAEKFFKEFKEANEKNNL